MKILILSLLTLLVSTNESAACTCYDRQDVQGEVLQSDAVFVGEVVAITRDTLGPNNEFKIIEYKIKVETAYKGQFSKDTISLFTGEGGCGVKLIMGYKFVIYGTKKSYISEGTRPVLPTGNNLYWAGFCSRTSPYNENEIRQIEAFLNK